MIVSIIVAVDNNYAIGNQNQLLCHLPADLAYFKKTTTGHHIIMGRKTYESIGKALPNRTNIIISRNESYEASGCIVVKSLQEAIDLAKKNNESELFITGGGTIYKEAMSLADRLYITKIDHQFNADTYFPIPGDEWQISKTESRKADEKNKFDFTFQLFEKQY